MSKLSTGKTTSSSFPLTSLISALVSALSKDTWYRLTVFTETVRSDNHLGLVENVGHVDTNDELGSGLGGEHGENTSSASNLSGQLCR